jgi:hypothetical protein
MLFSSRFPLRNFTSKGFWSAIGRAKRHRFSMREITQRKISKLVKRWPPSPAQEEEKKTRVDSDDVVLVAEAVGGSSPSHLLVTFRKRNGLQYIAFLPLPNHLIERAVALINRYPRLTVRELGDLQVY